MTTGVYQIMNRVNGRRYIAGSVNATQVLESTIRILSSDTRSGGVGLCLGLDRKISIDWRLYGRESFTWGILEKTLAEKSIISQRTLYWCRLLQPFYNEYDYSPIISGVYKIKNVVTKESYIGQSKDIYVRFSQHKSWLNQNIQPNKRLQNSWNQYGSNNFKFEILEECLPDRTILILLEKSWIKKTNNLFNIVV